MDILFEANKGILAIIIVLLSYLVYFLTGFTKFFKQLLGIYNKPVIKIVYQKINGGLILGGISFIIIKYIWNEPLFVFGLNFQNFNITLLLILFFGSLIIFITRFYSIKPKNLKIYPEIRISEWNISLFLLNGMSWAIYLFGYELMFRGFLLFSCMLVFDIYTSVIINSLLYALVHFHKGWVEILASVPMGIIMCILVIITGHIWVPFFVHLILAVSNDYFAINANKNMAFNN